MKHAFWREPEELNLCCLPKKKLRGDLSTALDGKDNFSWGVVG